MNTAATDATVAFRPLRHAGEAALAALLGRLAPGWSAWCRAWGVDAGRLAVRQPGDSGWRSARHWQAIGGSAWVGCSEAPLRAMLSTLLFGTDARSAVATGARVCEAVVESCLDDLKQCWAALGVAGERAGAESTGTGPGDDQDRRWSGALQVQDLLAGAGGSIWLQLAPAAAEAWLSPHRGPATAPPSRAPLAPPSEALAATALRFRVELASVRLPISSLRGLEIGDTLTLPHRLDAPLEVHAASDDPLAPPLCQAYLGRRGARRAIELTAFGASS